MTAAAASLFSPFQCSPNSIFQTSRMQHLFSIESKFDVLRNDSISFTEKSIWKKNQFEILSNLKIQFSFDILLAFKKQIGKNRKIQYSESINQLPLQIHNSIFLAEIGKDSFNTNPFWKYENIYEILKKVDLTFHWTSQLFTSNSNLNSSQKFSDLFWIFTLLRVLWHWILCFFGDSFRHLCLIFSDSFDICHSFWMIFFLIDFFFEIILGSAILFGYFRDSSQGQEVHNKRRRIAFKFFNKPQNKLDCKSVALVRWAVIGKLNRSQWRCVHGSRDPTVTFLDAVIG